MQRKKSFIFIDLCKNVNSAYANFRKMNLLFFFLQTLVWFFFKNVNACISYAKLMQTTFILSFLFQRLSKDIIIRFLKFMHRKYFILFQKLYKDLNTTFAMIMQRNHSFAFHFSYSVLFEY